MGVSIYLPPFHFPPPLVRMLLSAGYCEKASNATSEHELSALQPVVEVLSVEAFWHLDDRPGTTIFKCNISDGVHRIDAYLSTCFNPLILDERLRRHTVVRLTGVEVIHEPHSRWEDFKYLNATYQLSLVPESFLAWKYWPTHLRQLVDL